MTTKNERPPQREMPNNIEAEQALLGAMFMNNQAYQKVADFLKPEHFFEPLHREIFDIAVGLIAQNKPANPVTVKNFLRDTTRKIGDMTISEYMARLAREAVTILNAGDYGSAIYDLALRRELIVIGEEMVEVAYSSSYEESPQKQIEEASDRLFSMSEMSEALNGTTSFSGGELMNQYMDMLAKKPEKQKRSPGIPIALVEIQKILSEKYFEASNLYGMLSSSGEGKTSMMLVLAWAALDAGHPVCIFSYDQTGVQITSQMVAQKTGIEVKRQKNHDLTDRDYEAAVRVGGLISSLPFQVISCDMDKDTTHRLSQKAMGFLKRHGNGKTPLFLYDHIGAIPPEFDDRRSDEGTKARNIGQRIKNTMKKLAAVGIILQQRNGKGSLRFNPRPVPMDLFGGESARQPFDAIFYLFRPAEHMRRQTDIAKNDKEIADIEARFRSFVPLQYDLNEVAEVGTLKVRFGKNGLKQYVKFIGELTKYESFDDYHSSSSQQEELL